MKPAVFFDRDGTLIEDVHYLADPAKVRLLSGVAEAIRQLRVMGFACVVVTNQSAGGLASAALAMRQPTKWTIYETNIRKAARRRLRKAPLADMAQDIAKSSI